MRIQPHEALQRLSKRGVVGKAKGVKSSTPVEFVRGFGHNENLPTLYLFRKGVQGIITSSDDELPAVLGNCDTADFTVDLPPCMEDWLSEYDGEIAHWQYFGEQVPESDVTEDDGVRISISPIVKTTWGQTAPYNQNLLFDGKYARAGCTSLSAAQLLYTLYKGIHGVSYKRGCKKTPAYTTSTLSYKVASLPPIAVFDYESMTLKKPTTTKGKKAVAQMIEYIGKSITSNYRPDGTGASPTFLSQQLKNCFKMGYVEMILCTQLGAAKFEERVYNELRDGYPVIMNGYNDNKGHSFLCDGYDAAKDMYHINWGWDGSYNGYFRLSALNPGTTNYNARKIAIFVHPMYQWGDVNCDGNVDISDITNIVNDTLNGNNNSNSDINNDGSVNIADATLLSNKIIGK